jgi:hypothetical protein
LYTCFGGNDVRWKTRCAAVQASIALLLSLFAATGSPAQASVPTSYCGGRSYTFVVKNYTRGAAQLPLRCGNTRFGFNHITARWSAAFDANIALTIARGESATDVQQDGGSAIFALFDSRCNELFRVIYNGGAYNGTGVRPQGIITAYAPGVITTIALSGTARGTSRAAPAYRTDCAIIQNI